LRSSQAATLSALNDYYTDLFGIDRASLWHGVTVRRHTGRLQGFEGYYVAWRSGGVHVSMPLSGGFQVTGALSTAVVDTLQNPDFWREFAATRGLQVIGPSTHAYLDRDPGPLDGVTLPQDDDLRSLREAVDESDWAESGWNDQPPHIFGLYEEGLLVAAANLNLFHHQPRDIGVVVARGARGRGLSKKVAQHAASFAIRTHGFARWGARNSNAASLAASRRLGFERWCAQLGVR
jgi:GNAT superfamily N-acetyltransferase